MARLLLFVRGEEVRGRMDSQGAKVLPWSGKAMQVREGTPSAPGRRGEEPAFVPLEGLVIVMSDDQLEALATAFLMNPARRAMTFEAYLTVRGFARPAAG